MQRYYTKNTDQRTQCTLHLETHILCNKYFNICRVSIINTSTMFRYCSEFFMIIKKVCSIMTSRVRFWLRLIVCIARLWPVVDGVGPFMNFPAHCFALDFKKSSEKFFWNNLNTILLHTKYQIIVSLKTRAINIKLQKRDIYSTAVKVCRLNNEVTRFFVFRRSFKTFISEFVRV